MNTETPDKTNGQAGRGWVFYDAACPQCVALARRCRGVLARRGFALAPLQTDGLGERLGLDPGQLLAEMRVLTPDGRVLSGADAAVHLARCLWWAWPLHLLAQVPGMKPLLRWGYRRLAERRSCIGGRCGLQPTDSGRQNLPRAIPGWLPLLALPVVVSVLLLRQPGWVLMWALAVAIGLGFKWRTLYDVWPLVHPTSAWRVLGYLLAWPGMNARSFLSSLDPIRRPAFREWQWAIAKTLLGCALIWGIAPAMLAHHPLAGGWMAMTGIVFGLHFGGFHVISLVWRTAGVGAPPIMCAPLRATSLAEFWGVRWNRSFSELAQRYLLRPVARKHGLVPGTGLVYLASGLLHELVISVPARGGYGWPTAYFLTQWLGLLFERTALARRLGLGRPWRGWLFTLVVTAGPAFWLFHPPFVHNVIVPMIQSLRVPWKGIP